MDLDNVLRPVIQYLDNQTQTNNLIIIEEQTFAKTIISRVNLLANISEI